MRPTMITTNRNLLIIADILIVNRGFAEAKSRDRQRAGRRRARRHRMVRENPQPQLDVIAKAFGWTKAEASSNLKDVHLSNLPENVAFFSGAIDAAGSYNAYTSLPCWFMELLN